MLGSLDVIFNANRFIVLGSVQFYDQPSFGTIKIDDISVYYLLPKKTHRVGAQKIIPEMSFFLCHLFSEFLCVWTQFLVVMVVHFPIPPPTSWAPPFARGGFKCGFPLLAPIVRGRFFYSSLAPTASVSASLSSSPSSFSVLAMEITRLPSCTRMRRTP